MKLILLLCCKQRRQWSYLFLINIEFNSFERRRKKSFLVYLVVSNISFMIVKIETFLCSTISFFPFHFNFGRMLNEIVASAIHPSYVCSALNSLQKNERCTLGKSLKKRHETLFFLFYQPDCNWIFFLQCCGKTFQLFIFCSYATFFRCDLNFNTC